MLVVWRVVIAFVAVFGLGAMVTAMGLYTYGRRRRHHVASISPTAAFVGMIGGCATMVYAAAFRVHDLVVARPFNLGDVLGVPPVFLFALAGVALVRDIGRIIGHYDIEDLREEARRKHERGKHEWPTSS